MEEEKRVVGYHLKLISEHLWRGGPNYNSKGKIPIGLFPVPDLHYIQDTIETDKLNWVQNFVVPTSSDARLYSDSWLYTYSDRNGVIARFVLPLHAKPYASEIHLFSTNPDLIRKSLDDFLGLTTNGFQLRVGNPF